MMIDLKVLEHALDRLLYVYATDDEAEGAVVRALLSNPALSHAIPLLAKASCSVLLPCVCKPVATLPISS